MLVTWRLERLLGIGPALALVTGLIPAAMAFAIRSGTDVANVLGGLLVAAVIIALGTVFGSMLMSGLGVALFGGLAAVADIGPAALLGVGVGLFASLIVHDLSATVRRDPSVHPSLWIRAVANVAIVTLAAALLFTIAYVVATASTWQVLLFPFGIVAIGFATRFAADSHTRTVQKP